MDAGTIKLTVSESYTRDVGRFYARIDYDTMDKLRLSTGDVFEICGKGKCVAKCMPLYPSDEDKGMLRADGIIRKNCEIQIGDTVTIKKVKAEACTKLIVKPNEAIPPLDERYIIDALEGIPTMNGQIFKIPYYGSQISFTVNRVEPEGIVLITQHSTCIIIDSPEHEAFSEFEGMFKSQRDELITKLKDGLKQKNAEEIQNAIERINDIDLITENVNQILSGQKIKQKPQYKRTISDIIEEAFTKWVEKESEKDKK